MPVVSDKYRGTTDYALVLGELIRAAQYRGLTTYQDIAPLVGLPQAGHHMAREIGLILGAISEDEVVLAHRPMLSALAVNVKGDPGPGFFGLARDLGRLDQNADESAFWKAERDDVYKAWRRRLPEVRISSAGDG